MAVGVISHLPNPTFDQVRSLARAAEAAGADWLGVPDAFWWRDTSLLWAIPQSDLARSASIVTSKGKPEIVWAPLVDHGGASRERVHTIAAYSVLNSNTPLHERWGLAPPDLARLRELLVGGGAAAAQ